MVMGVCGASKVNNWTVFDSLDLTSQEEEEEEEEEEEKGLLGRTDRGPTKKSKNDLNKKKKKISQKNK